MQRRAPIRVASVAVRPDAQQVDDGVGLVVDHRHVQDGGLPLRVPQLEVGPGLQY